MAILPLSGTDDRFSKSSLATPRARSVDARTAALTSVPIRRRNRACRARGHPDRARGRPPPSGLSDRPGGSRGSRRRRASDEPVNAATFCDTFKSSSANSPRDANPERKSTSVPRQRKPEVGRREPHLDRALQRVASRDEWRELRDPAVSFRADFRSAISLAPRA